MTPESYLEFGGKDENCEGSNFVSRLQGYDTSFNDEELKELHGLTTNLHSLAKFNSSMTSQKSCQHWLKESDANPKFFLV